LIFFELNAQLGDSSHTGKTPSGSTYPMLHPSYQDNVINTYLDFLQRRHRKSYPLVWTFYGAYLFDTAVEQRQRHARLARDSQEDLPELIDEIPAISSADNHVPVCTTSTPKTDPVVLEERTLIQDIDVDTHAPKLVPDAHIPVPATETPAPMQFLNMHTPMPVDRMLVSFADINMHAPKLVTDAHIPVPAAETPAPMPVDRMLVSFADFNVHAPKLVLDAHIPVIPAAETPAPVTDINMHAPMLVSNARTPFPVDGVPALMSPNINMHDPMPVDGIPAPGPLFLPSSDPQTPLNHGGQLLLTPELSPMSQFMLSQAQYPIDGWQLDSLDGQFWSQFSINQDMLPMDSGGNDSPAELQLGTALNQTPFNATDADITDKHCDIPGSDLDIVKDADANADSGKKRKRSREEEENAALILPAGQRRAHKPRVFSDGETAWSGSKWIK
jgi:hypothetical protein